MRQQPLVGLWIACGAYLALVGVPSWLRPTPRQALGTADAGTCANNVANRQLDYWLGEWTVTYPGTPGGSASSVSLDLDQCLLVEKWDGGKGHRGENMFAYSPDDQHWHGMFADNQGRVHMFDGTVASGIAEFDGPSRGANGETVLNRIKVTRMDENRVEQSWEKSADKGVTWKTEFRGEYARKHR